MPASDQDLKHMSSCLELAKQALGRTAPNPMVGAIVVDSEGNVIGRAYHAKAGEDHAEVIALRQAGDKAAGGTLYVSLEPCCHFGKTPPCVNAVIASGVKKIIVGMQDPNPLVAGKGIDALSKAGIEVSVGTLEGQCRLLNRGFIKTIEQNLPWLALKLATTLDGKIADRNHVSRWISGPEARTYVHKLRNEFDCVLIGATTATQDNPQLTVHDLEDGRDPVRAVFDTRLSIDPKSQLCQKGSGGQTIIFCSKQALDKRGREFPSHVTLVACDKVSGHLDPRFALGALKDFGVLTVLCEGGSRLGGALLANSLVDEIQWIVSPKIIGDSQAIPAVTSFSEVLLSDALQLNNLQIERLGNDTVIAGTISDWL